MSRGWKYGLLLLTFCVVLTQSATADDSDKLKGTWTIVSVEKAGKKADEKDIKAFADKFSLTFGEGTFSTTLPENTKGTFKLDTSKEPAEITMTRDKVDDVRGIYKFDGDKLILCSGKPGDPRPTKFETDPKSSAIMLVMKRKGK